MSFQGVKENCCVILIEILPSIDTVFSGEMHVGCWEIDDEKRNWRRNWMKKQIGWAEEENCCRLPLSSRHSQVASCRVILVGFSFEVSLWPQFLRIRLHCASLMRLIVMLKSRCRRHKRSKISGFLWHVKMPDRGSTTAQIIPNRKLPKLTRCAKPLKQELSE